MKRRKVKSKGAKERYKHLNAEFQRIAGRDKKAFLSDQCNACKIPGIEEPGGLQSMGSLSSQTRLHFHFSVSCIGEGNGNLLQCSCLENPRDGRVWWAAVSGVAQRWTQLKRLSSSSSSSDYIRRRQRHPTPVLLPVKFQG